MNSYSVEDDRWLTFGLAFVGGFGDAAGFILGKTFTGHVTGNLVLVAISLVSHDSRSVVRQLLAIIMFLLGVLVSAVIARVRSSRSAAQILPLVMLLEVLLMSAAALVLASQLNIRVEIFLACVSLALGLQNGTFRRAGGTGVHTTYLTGMTTNLIASVVGRDHAEHIAPTAPGQLPANHTLAGIWVAFVGGAAAGAALTFRLGGFGILGAAAILIALVVQISMAARASSSARTN